jgi:hypothetical protein
MYPVEVNNSKVEYGGSLVWYHALKTSLKKLGRRREKERREE